MQNPKQTLSPQRSLTSTPLEMTTQMPPEKDHRCFRCGASFRASDGILLPKYGRGLSLASLNKGRNEARHTLSLHRGTPLYKRGQGAGCQGLVRGFIQLFIQQTFIELQPRPQHCSSLHAHRRRCALA